MTKTGPRPTVEDAVGAYRSRIERLAIDAFAERLGPAVATALAAAMCEIFKAGVILGLGQAVPPESSSVLLHMAPKGHA